jgi:hypothetical protein
MVMMNTNFLQMNADMYINFTESIFQFKQEYNERCYILCFKGLNKTDFNPFAYRYLYKKCKGIF